MGNISLTHDEPSMEGVAQEATVEDVQTDVTAIRGVTDVIPDAGAMTTISDETDKINGAAADALAGIEGSVAWRVGLIEQNLLSNVRWFEAATVPAGETHIADRLGVGAGAFQADADNDDWGAWVQILGSDDTPLLVGGTFFAVYQIMIEAAERASTYFLQMSYGATGDAGLAADHYTEIIYGITPVIDVGNILMQSDRVPSGTKFWMRTKCPGQNTGTIDFYFSIHEFAVT
jgi:hypothetical protein